MITAKRRGMVIAINQREALLVASCYERWFHTSLRCVADGCWIQKSLGLVTPVAMSVPTAKTKSHCLLDQALTFGRRKTADVRLVRFWDRVVPIAGRIRVPKRRVIPSREDDEGPHSRSCGDAMYKCDQQRDWEVLRFAQEDSSARQSQQRFCAPAGAPVH